MENVARFARNMRPSLWFLYMVWVYKEDSTAENERAYIESEDHDASFIVDVVV